jgi:hypothetical protein
MTTRSSRSSLVGPPTTVVEGDDDSIPGDLPYQNENRPNWNTQRFNSRYANDALVEDLDNFALSPPIERAIKDFNDELDSLTKSFEAISQKKGRNQLQDSSTPSSYTPHMPYPSTAKKMMSPLREKDPPSSVKGVSPLRSYVHSTPAKRSGSASYTPSEPPPAPMETPGFGFPTPNRNRTRTTTAPRVDDSSSYAAPSVRRPDQHDSKIEELEKRIREQAIRIQDLEIENEVLRKKLELQQPPRVERVHRSSSLSDHLRAEEPTNGYIPQSGGVPPPPPNHRHHRYEPSGEAVEPEGPSRRGVTPADRSTVREEPGGRHQPSAAASYGMSHSPYRTQSSFLSTPSRRQQHQQQQPIVDRPPRHISTLSEAIEEIGDHFTPGTRFVSQLSTLMKLENSHHAPLSMILDKHWDTLKHNFQHEDRGRYQQ